MIVRNLIYKFLFYQYCAIYILWSTWISSLYVGLNLFCFYFCPLNSFLSVFSIIFFIYICFFIILVRLFVENSIFHNNKSGFVLLDEKFTILINERFFGDVFNIFKKSFFCIFVALISAQRVHAGEKEKSVSEDPENIQEMSSPSLLQPLETCVSVAKGLEEKRLDENHFARGDLRKSQVAEEKVLTTLRTNPEHMSDPKNREEVSEALKINKEKKEELDKRSEEELKKSEEPFFKFTNPIDVSDNTVDDFNAGGMGP